MGSPIAQSVQTQDHPYVLHLRTLLTARKRAGLRRVLLEDEFNIRGAIDAGLRIRVVLVAARRSRGTRLPAFLADLPAGTPVLTITSEVLGDIFEGTRVPSLVAIAELPARSRLSSLAHLAGDIIVLDDLVGPGNIGSIIRLSAAFEAAGIVFLNQPYMQIYRRGIVRASAGTMFKIPLVSATTRSFVGFCRLTGVRIVLTSPHAGHDVTQVAADGTRHAIVFGNEARGCAQELEPYATFRCRIPLSPQVESLNVSAAASILLFLRSRYHTGRG